MNPTATFVCYLVALVLFLVQWVRADFRDFTAAGLAAAPSSAVRKPMIGIAR